MRVDAHTHFIPDAYLEEIRIRGVSSLTLEKNATGELAVVTGSYRFPVSTALRAPEAHLARMETAGVGLHVISPPTFMFHYSDSPERALELARVVNDAYAGIVRAHPGRFAAMGTVPLQDPETACAELRRVREELGIRAVEIGSSIHGLPLDDPSLDPFFAEAENLGVFVFVHPYSQWLIGQDHLGMAYLKNLCGLPMNTAWAIGRVIFSGLPARHPGLRLGFAHVGGVAPMLLGRWDHGWEVREECRRQLSEPPSRAFGRLFFDTVTHDPEAYRLMLDWVSPDRLFLGSDFPFDMGTDDSVSAVEEMPGLTGTQREVILGGTAAGILGL